MKIVEVFIDESGPVRDCEQMVIAGIGIVSQSEPQRTKFHNDFASTVDEEGLSSGVHDAGGIAPQTILRKRPGNAPKADASPEEVARWEAALAFWSSEVTRLFALTDAVARRHDIRIFAFSFRFDARSPRKWLPQDESVARFLDRPYSERLKDVLELVIWHVPEVATIIGKSEPLLLCFDLASRIVVEENQGTDQNDLAKRIEDIRWAWGVAAQRNDTQPGEPLEIRAPTLGPSDAIEVLTATLNRRGALPSTSMVERARCCRLIDWGDAAARQIQPSARFLGQSILPKAVHHVADLLSNRIYRNRAPLHEEPMATWFRRGFRIDAGEDADAWIAACRDYALGHRARAILRLRNARFSPDERTWTTHFFANSAASWPNCLTASDLRAIFDGFRQLQHEAP